MPKYLVGDSEFPLGDQDFCIVTAGSKREAEGRYLLAKVIHSGDFLEQVQSRVVNSSFAEKFWFQTEEEERRFLLNSEIVIDGDEFKRRVRHFFKDRPAYGELYLKHWYGDDQEFPDEMLLMIFRYISWMFITVVDLDEVEAI